MAGIEASAGWLHLLFRSAPLVALEPYREGRTSDCRLTVDGMRQTLFIGGMALLYDLHKWIGQSRVKAHA
jgi:hypothetical protein